MSTDPPPYGFTVVDASMSYDDTSWWLQSLRWESPEERAWREWQRRGWLKRFRDWLTHESPPPHPAVKTWTYTPGGT